MHSLIIHCEFGKVQIVDEPTYVFGSVDNDRRYQHEMPLAFDERLTSVHGVLFDDEPMVVFGGGGGCSTVHEHSALVLNSRLYLAIGDRIACFVPLDHSLAWSLKVDSATCFGVYYNLRHQALLSHGELEIARINEDGKSSGPGPVQTSFQKGFGSKRSTSPRLILKAGNIALAMKLAR